MLHLILLERLLLNEPATRVTASDAHAVQWTFERELIGAPPSGWDSRGGSARGIYSISEDPDGNRYLAATSRSSDVQLGVELDSAAGEPRVLSWRWRVRELPRDADERRLEALDSAASVYAVFGSRLFPRVIKYVWSTSVPAGTRFNHPRSHRVAIVVVASGAEGLGRWHRVTRDLGADAREIWSGDPGPLLGIGVKTDSDSTESSARADYDDFLLTTAQHLEKGEHP